MIGLLKDIKGQRPKGVRYLGLDIGQKTIGLAVSNDGGTVATPLETIQRSKFSKDLEQLAKIIKEYEIGGYILGWPVDMHGDDVMLTAQCDRVRSFADELAKQRDVVGQNPWISLWDESFSTKTVEEFLIKDVDMSRTKRAQVVDKLAAQVILQSALEYLN